MYAILDIETTGGAYNQEGITEIAIYKFDGVEIVDRMVSLVNPERPIQPYVSELTKITEPMLRLAPKFYEIAKRIIEISTDCIIVAHNAQFDYRMLKLEFHRLGYDFKRETLCTVNLSKKLLPDAPSYSLGKLVRSLGIPISDRHRADGDAKATIKLFEFLLTRDTHKEIVKQHITFQDTLDEAYRFFHLIENTPATIGLFYFYNKNKEILYIGKATNIQKRVRQLLTAKSRIGIRLQNLIHSISYEETGNELIASLKEREEQKIHKPTLNISKRKPLFLWSLYQSLSDPESFVINKTDRRRKRIASFKSPQEAKAFVEKINEKLITEKSDKNIVDFTSDYFAKYSDILIQMKGRNLNERSALVIQNNKVIGYCYYDLNYQINQQNILQHKLIPLNHSEELLAITQDYIRKNKDYKTLPLSL